MTGELFVMGNWFRSSWAFMGVGRFICSSPSDMVAATVPDASPDVSACRIPFSSLIMVRESVLASPIMSSNSATQSSTSSTSQSAMASAIFSMKVATSSPMLKISWVNSRWRNVAVNTCIIYGHPSLSRSDSLRLPMKLVFLTKKDFNSVGHDLLHASPN